MTRKWPKYVLRDIWPKIFEMSQFSVTFSYSVPMKFGKFTKQYEYSTVNGHAWWLDWFYQQWMIWLATGWMTVNYHYHSYISSACVNPNSVPWSGVSLFGRASLFVYNILHTFKYKFPCTLYNTVQYVKVPMPAHLEFSWLLHTLNFISLCVVDVL